MNEQDEQCYDLFRRAIVQRDEEAWAAIHARYRPLLIAWARRYDAHGMGSERSDDIADRALARAWAALTPERFAEFPSLARLLSYLRVCVATTVIDGARAQAYDERARPIHSESAPTPEQIVLSRLDQQVFWHLVLAHVATPTEHLVLVESIIYGFPPRSIRSRHPQLFPDVTTVYSIKRKLLERLQRDPELLRLRREFASI